MDVKELTKRIWYFGVQRKCPLCAASTRTRKTFSFDVLAMRAGGEYVERDDCPVCGADRRSRLVFQFLKARDLQAGAVVLHVAPERALYRHFFRSANVEYHPADLVPELHPDIPKVEKVDIADIPYPAGTFDLILCNQVLEHVRDQRKAMKELCRVLKDDGIVLLQVPLGGKLPATDEDLSIVDKKERDRRIGLSDLLRQYSEQDWLGRLKEAGLQVESRTADQIASGDEMVSYGLKPRERIFIARRAADAERTRPGQSAGSVALMRAGGVKRPETA